ncbi:MAG: hypothetical protein ACTSV5_05910 [Promethearchaeota archaeon]
MSKKGSIILICILAIGTGLIPTGMLINSTINSEVVNSIDEGLLGIQEKALPFVEDMIAESGIPRALRDIRKIGLTETEAIINATFFMMVLNMTLNEPAVLGVVPINLLFDRWIQWVLIIPVTFSSAMQSLGYPPIKGISEYYQQNLWYGNAKYLLMNGTESLPGLIGNNTLGTGVLDFLDLYDNALGNTTLEQAIEIGYNTTWNKLTKLTEYYREYFVPVAIPMIVASLDILMPEYSGMDTKSIAEMYYFAQWANCSMFEDGIDLSTMVDDLNESVYGFELDLLVPSNITKLSCDLLWEDNNPHSLTNDTGINEWIKARDNETILEELRTEFFLEDSQIRMIDYWLWNASFKLDLMPILITLPPQLGKNMTLEDFAVVIFLEVWTNGTADGRSLYPYGFPLEMQATTAYGFEIGYQSQTKPVIPTNISLSSARSLWNTSNPFSLVTKNGIKEWFKAIDNPNSATAYGLKMANSLEDEQLLLILSWLPRFKDNVMPFLAQEKMDLPLDSTTLGNTIQTSMIVSGASVMGLAGLGLVRKGIIKKRAR